MIYICVYIYVCIYIYIHTYIHKHISIYIHTYTPDHTHRAPWPRTYSAKQLWYAYIHTYIRIHIHTYPIICIEHDGHKHIQQNNGRNQRPKHEKGGPKDSIGPVTHMCVCGVYVCYIYIHTYIFIYIYIHTHINVHVPIVYVLRGYEYTRISHTFVLNTFTYIHLRTYACMQATFPWTRRQNLKRCACITYIYIYTLTYIHMYVGYLSLLFHHDVIKDGTLCF
jgi:hypothetical protein